MSSAAAAPAYRGRRRVGRLSRRQRSPAVGRQPRGPHRPRARRAVRGHHAAPAAARAGTELGRGRPAAGLRELGRRHRGFTNNALVADADQRASHHAAAGAVARRARGAVGKRERGAHGGAAGACLRGVPRDGLGGHDMVQSADAARRRVRRRSSRRRSRRRGLHPASRWSTPPRPFPDADRSHRRSPAGERTVSVPDDRVDVPGGDVCMRRWSSAGGLGGAPPLPGGRAFRRPFADGCRDHADAHARRRDHRGGHAGHRGRPAHAPPRLRWRRRAAGRSCGGRRRHGGAVAVQRSDAAAADDGRAERMVSRVDPCAGARGDRHWRAHRGSGRR